MDRKLIFFCASLQAGGAERVLSVLSKPIADTFDSIEYLMWYDAPVFYDVDKRVKLVSVESGCDSKNIMRKLWWIRRHVGKVKPDLLVSFSAPFNMLALFALLFTHTPIVVAERNDPNAFRWGRFYKRLRDFLYTHAKGILVQTDTSRSYFNGSPLSQKVEIIFNPIFMESTVVGSALHTSKRPLVVTAARLVHQKRMDLLIEVFAQFRNTHPEYELCIYGDGKEKKQLQQLINKLGQQSHIKLCGRVHNLWECLQPATMFVTTSLFEGMSNSLIEAMCLGLPCVSTKVSGATDLIVNTQNGYLIEIDDRDALLRSMSEIAGNPQKAQQIGLEASRLYNKLKVEKIATLWVEYIKRQMAVVD